MFRLASKKEATRKLADQPTRFMEIKQTDSDFLVVPEVSSEKRRYVPMGYMDSSVICSNTARFVPFASLYHFGVLESNVHMAWMRTICGRLGMSYRYSSEIVYNNFPWPSPTEKQKAAIEKTAQEILNVRAKYPESSLADLYDDLAMPPELRKAHQENDKAVMRSYGMSIRDTTESSCVAELMRLYQEKVRSRAISD